MMELNVLMKKTVELSYDEMNSLIALKQQHWGYTDEQQRRWFSENIMADDYHLQIYGGGVLLAYLNAVNVDVDINQTLHRMLGIGNVCVDKKNAHAGVGSILMACINAFVKQSDTCGILLCKGKWIPFYVTSNWRLINPERIIVADNRFEHSIMLFDPHKKIASDDKSSFHISRNF